MLLNYTTTRINYTTKYSGYSRVGASLIYLGHNTHALVRNRRALHQIVIHRRQFVI